MTHPSRHLDLSLVLIQHDRLLDGVHVEAAIVTLRKVILDGAAQFLSGVWVEIVRELLKHFVTVQDRKSTRLNSSHGYISYAVFCLKKKKKSRHTLYACHN